MLVLSFRIRVAFGTVTSFAFNISHISRFIINHQTLTIFHHLLSSCHYRATLWALFLITGLTYNVRYPVTAAWAYTISARSGSILTAHASASATTALAGTSPCAGTLTKRTRTVSSRHNKFSFLLLKSLSTPSSSASTSTSSSRHNKLSFIFFTNHRDLFFLCVHDPLDRAPFLDQTVDSNGLYLPNHMKGIIQAH